VSFAGKHVTAPLAAQIARGTPLSALGEPMDPAEFHRLTIPDGTIVHIDNFGLMKFTGSLDGLSEGQRCQVRVNGRTIDVVHGLRLMSYDDGQWVIFPGSSYGLPELGMVRRSGIAEIDAKVGDRVEILQRVPA
jgi:S-adenosylmethionine hydrolase